MYDGMERQKAPPPHIWRNYQMELNNVGECWSIQTLLLQGAARIFRRAVKLILNEEVGKPAT